MKNKFIYLLAALICAVTVPFAAAGCNKRDENVLRINEVTHSVFYAPLYLADALGYFDEEGFKIELTNGGGADATIAAVFSDSADIGFCGPEAALYVNVGGSEDRPMVFGQLTKRDGSFLVGRNPQPDFEWSDLQGKRILAGRPGGVPAMTFEYVLHEEGIVATLVDDVAFNMMAAAFENGVGDYCTMFEPVASEYQKANKGYIVASVGQKSGEVPYTCFMAKKSYIDSHQDKIEGLLRAVTKAIKYTITASTAEIAQKLTPYFADTSVESLQTSVESYKEIDAWVTDMAMKEESFTRLQDIIDLAGELDRRVAFSEMILTSPAHEIFEEIFA